MVTAEKYTYIFVKNGGKYVKNKTGRKIRKLMSLKVETNEKRLLNDYVKMALKNVK